MWIAVIVIAIIAGICFESWLDYKRAVKDNDKNC